MGANSSTLLGGWLRWLVTRRPAVANRADLSVPFLEVERYQPPEWAAALSLVPRERVGLAMLPTPVHPWRLPGLPPNVQVWIKRDDLTGMQLSGNKVRKLEFLLADAKRQGADCVVTIGGIQSNHCRATAVAARYLGLEAHLLLRTSRQAVGADPGLEGNLLVDRMVGAHIHLVTKEEYGQHGSKALGEALVRQLQAQGKRPYLIPVGGSNALGTWGYLQAVEEIRQQCASQGFTDLVMACGSGGTTAGLALGVKLSGLKLNVHAYGVCDDPNYFYDYIDDLLDDLGAGTAPGGLGCASRGLLRAVQARGLGYAMSSEAELQTVQAVAEATGVVLDPVYSGKAVHALLQEMRDQPEAWANRKVLFVHTGGLLGMYDGDKLRQLQALPAQPAQPAAKPPRGASSSGGSTSSSSWVSTSQGGAQLQPLGGGAGAAAASGGGAGQGPGAAYGSRVQRFVVPPKPAQGGRA